MEKDPVSETCSVQNTAKLQFNDPEFANFPCLASSSTDNKSMINFLNFPQFGAQNALVS
jgi:hypothetical protein